MDALLERLSSAQIVAVISILAGGIVALAMIVAISKYQFQSLAEDSLLRREKQQAELSLRERLVERAAASGASIESLLELDLIPSEPDSRDTELAKRFGMLDASAEDIERALKQALAVDAAHKKMIVAVMDELLECGAESAAILAAVRPLCAAARPAKEGSRFSPTPWREILNDSRWAGANAAPAPSRFPSRSTSRGRHAPLSCQSSLGCHAFRTG